jgi:two-component system, cell cycle sensor histidine kinase and response regulator CckA
MMNNNQKKPPVSWTLITVFIVFSSVILFTGYRYISNQRRNTIEIKKEELNAFANLKAGQIVRWWHERLGDAIVLEQNYPLIEEVEFFLKNPGHKQSKEAISQLLGSIIYTFDYQNAIILDNSNNVRLAIPANDSIIEKYMHPLIPEITAEKRVLLTDLHRASPDKQAQLDLIIPLEIKHRSEVISVGTIIMRLDPEKILYPIVRSWPTQSNTSETVLLRKDGDSVVYLNVLRHLKDEPLTVRRAIADTNLLGSKAVRGQSGVVRGVDYRGVEVMGAIKKIAGSGWYMVSKVDLKEINDTVITAMMPVLLLIIFMISAFGAVIGWTIWHQRVRFYKDRYEAEHERMALRKHFEYILQYANDIILLLDTDLNIVEANDHAFEIYQYSRKEMIGAGIRLLRLPGSDEQLSKTLEVLNNEGTAIYEAVHRRKDGSTFPVEISARVFEIEGKKYYQSIGRDITDRKVIEERLKTILDRYNLAIKAASLAVWDYDILNNRLIWDEKVYELYGVKKEDFPPVYESWLKMVHPDDQGCTER